jgi:hypothetical protein
MAVTSMITKSAAKEAGKALAKFGKKQLGTAGIQALVNRYTLPEILEARDWSLKELWEYSIRSTRIFPLVRQEENHFHFTAHVELKTLAPVHFAVKMRDISITAGNMQVGSLKVVTSDATMTVSDGHGELRIQCFGNVGLGAEIKKVDVKFSYRPVVCRGENELPIDYESSISTTYIQ